MIQYNHDATYSTVTKKFITYFELAKDNVCLIVIILKERYDRGKTAPHCMCLYCIGVGICVK